MGNGTLYAITGDVLTLTGAMFGRMDEYLVVAYVSGDGPN
jgi:hypothetical protein